MAADGSPPKVDGAEENFIFVWLRPLRACDVCLDAQLQVECVARYHLWRRRLLIRLNLLFIH